MLAAQAAVLSATDLEFLRRAFRKQTTTHGWPGRNTYRFERDDARVLIWDAEDQADWFVTTNTAEQAAALAKQLWSCSNLASALYGVGAEGKAILQQLRGS